MESIVKISRPESARMGDAMTIALSATDLLEQLVTGRLQPSHDHLQIIAGGFHQAAALLGSHAPLSAIAVDAQLAGEMLWLADKKVPGAFTEERKQSIVTMLYGAADRLSLIEVEASNG